MRLGRSFESFQPFSALHSSLPVKSSVNPGFFSSTRRGIATLRLKNLTRTYTDAELLAMSLRGVVPTVNLTNANLNLWGRDVFFEKNKEYRASTSTQNQSITIDQEILVDGQAPIFFKEEGYFGLGTQLTSFFRRLKLETIKEPEPHDPTNGREQSIRFDGVGCYYNLTYSITTISPQTVDGPIRYVVPETPSPTKGNLRLKSVICFDTTEYVEDDVMIKIDDLNGLVKKLPQFHIVKGKIEHFNAQPDQYDSNLKVLGEDHPFYRWAKIEMREADSGLRGKDDYLGTEKVFTSEKSSFSLVSTFTESSTKYHMIYDVLPGENDPNDNSYVYVVPKVFMPNGGISVWMGTFLPLTKPVTLTYSVDGKETKTKVVQPDEWDIAKPIENGPTSIEVRSITFPVEIAPHIRDPKKNGADDMQFEKAYSSNNRTYAAGARFLPSRILNSSFEIILGSCFERTFDNGRVAKSIRALYPDFPKIPNVKFFNGDQVYLDHPAKDFLRNKITYLDLAKRFVLAYEESWEKLSPVYSYGANYFISDDHEFYNNFPNSAGFMGIFSFLDRFSRNHYNQHYLNEWARIAKCYFNAVQTTDVVKQFNIGKELSFLIVDTQIQRDRNTSTFLQSRNFLKITSWLGQLTMPGVLVLGQPVLNTAHQAEFNLPDYTDQYKKLVEAIANSKHDVVVLSGDVHFSRFASVHLPRNNKMLYEIIASPLSLVELTPERDDCNPDVVTSYILNKDYIEAAAAAGWHIGPDGLDKYKYPEFFPPETVVTNYERKKVDYEVAGTHSQYQIDDPNYIPPVTHSYPPEPVPKKTVARRTVENFAKIRFFRLQTEDSRDNLMMEVKSYRVREVDSDNLPVLDWERTKRLT